MKNKKPSLRKRLERVKIALLIAFDIAAFFISMHFAALLFYNLTLGAFIAQNIYFTALALFAVILNFYFCDLYYTLKDFRRFRQITNLLLAVAFSFLLISFVAFWDRAFIVRRMFISFFFFMVFILTLANRVAFSILHKTLKDKNALFIGNTDIGRTLIEQIAMVEKSGRNLGINIVGYVSDEKEESGKKYTGALRLGGYEDIPQIVESKEVDLLIYAIDDLGNSRLNETIIHEKLTRVHLVSAIALFTAISGKIPYENISSSWLIEECLRGGKFVTTKIKRAVDLILGLVFFVFSLPLIAICAVAVKLETKGPAFFIQQRIGRFNKPFKFYKLRSMRTTQDMLAEPDNKKIAAAERWWELSNLIGEQLLEEEVLKKDLIFEKEQQEKEEGVHDIHKWRIARVGYFIRKFHIDELPQFWNVVKGDMSIVGPRPEMEMFIKQCEKTIPFYRLRLAVKPGVTGWAQVWYLHTSTQLEYKNKFKYDLYYLANMSLRLDFEIIVRTALRILGIPRIQPYS